DRFGAARQKVNMIQVARRALGQKIGKIFGRTGSEERRMGIGHFVELILDGLDDNGVPMPQTRHRRPARSVDIRFVVLVEQFYALAAHCKGQLLLWIAMKYMSHEAPYSTFVA